MVKVITRPWKPTDRALDVLTTVTAIGSRKEAGAPLGISYRTVEAHMSRLRIGSHAVSDGQLALIWHDEIAARLPRIMALITALVAVQAVAPVQLVNGGDIASHVEPNGA